MSALELMLQIQDAKREGHNGLARALWAILKSDHPHLFRSYARNYSPLAYPEIPQPLTVSPG